MSSGQGALGELAIGEALSASGPAMEISPSAGHTAGGRTISVTYTGGAATSATPIAIQSGPGSASAYAVDTPGVNGTAHFTYTQAGIDATPTVFVDANALTASYSNAAVSPGAPTSVTVVDNHNGTLTISFVAPADNGGASITVYRATWASGSYNTGAASPITITLTGLENLVLGTATVYATNSVGNGSNGTSASATPDNTNTVTFNATLTFPIGITPGAGLAYRLWGREGGSIVAITPWKTTGLTLTTDMTAGASQPAGYTINATIPWNHTDSSFAGLVELRSESASPTYVRRAVNVYGSARAATVHFVSMHTFLPADTITAVGVRVFSNAAGVESDDIAHTTTGVVEVNGSDNVYAYDVALAPDYRSGLAKFIVWDTGGTPVYDLDTVTIPARTSIAGAQPFNIAATWPSGTTLSTIGYQIRYLSAGSWVSTAWLTAGAVATAGMDGAGSQSAGATLSGTFTPTEADGSTAAIWVARSHSSSPVYAMGELNLQATVTAGATVALNKIMPALSTDVFTTPGYRVYKNVLGTVTAVAARVTANIVAIPEFANGYGARITYDPSLEVFTKWDEDETVYMQDVVFFPTYAEIPSPPVTPPAASGGGGGAGTSRHYGTLSASIGQEPAWIRSLASRHVAAEKKRKKLEVKLHEVMAIPTLDVSKLQAQIEALQAQIDEQSRIMDEMMDKIAKALQEEEEEAAILSVLVLH